MSECKKCYWNGYVECCLGWKPNVDCSKDYEPIDDYFYEWLTKMCGIPKEMLVKKGKFYEWKKRE